MIPQDSAMFWLPRLAKTWMAGSTHDTSALRLLPKTIAINYEQESLKWEENAWSDLWFAVRDACLSIGYPCFVRSDITSAKHSGVNAWRIRDEADIQGAVAETVRQSELKTYFSKVKPSAILVREFIHSEGHRTAFHGLQIGREWRVFADQHGSLCFHKYWPLEALTGHMDDGNVPDQMKDLFHWAPSVVIDAAVTAAKAMGEGAWSVDFMLDKDGKVWLTDMATAGNSYHAEGCQFEKRWKENSLEG